MEQTQAAETELSLSAEQVAALRSAPLGGARNRILIALALARGTQTVLAKIARVHPSNLSSIVNGQYSGIQLETCQRLAAAFGPEVLVDDLFPPTHAGEAVA